VLTVSPLGSGQAGYYLSLTATSYYVEGPEPEGRWYGFGAEEFDLSGTVKAHDLEKLCEGYDPRDPARHVRNAGVTEGEQARKHGDDLCFSPPKSVSVAWALGSEELREAIQAKLDRAVKDALDYIQETCGIARVGAQGQELARVPLTFALFEHSSSRLGDPQLHVHAVCPNLALHEARGGRLRVTAIDSTNFYYEQMTAGALFRASLAQGLRELGFGIERDGSSFRIAGISESLCERFSQRRAEIVEGILKAAKFVGPMTEVDAREVLWASRGRRAEVVNLDTRKGKKEYTRAELFEDWQEIAHSLGFGGQHVEGLRQKQPQALAIEEKRNIAEGIAKDTRQALIDEYAHFAERNLIRKLAEESQGRGLNARDVRELSAAKIAAGDFLKIGELVTERKHETKRSFRDRTQVRYTTPETLEMEGLLLASVGRMALESSPVSREMVERVIELRPTLSDEQANAVRLLAAGPGRIACMTGKAGTGKSTTLDACRLAFELDGREVIGCALAGVAADELRRSANIKSDTLARTLFRLEKGELTLTPKHVVVLDEAGMVPTKQLQKLAHQVEKGGAKLVLVGDPAQLQSIGAGGPFNSISERLGPEGNCQLTKIRRQRHEWARTTVEQFSKGEARQALIAYFEKKQLHVTKTREEAFSGLVERWKADGGLTNSKDVLLLAGLNAEVRAINRKCQEERRAAGLLGETRIFVNGDYIHEKDQIMLGKNSRPLDVKNGFTAQVVKIDEAKKALTVKLDRDGRQVTLSVEEYGAKNFRLGYATSVHKAQGRTVEHCHVLMGGPMDDLHLGYVQASRSRESTHLFIDKAHAGPNLKEAIRSLSRARIKDLARDHLERAQELPRLAPQERPEHAQKLRHELSMSL